MGRHKGIIHYTIGQRKGLGISAPEPVYVTKIDPEHNRIVVSDKSSLFSKGLIAKDLNLISIDKLQEPLRVMVKIRLQHKGVEAELSPYGDNRAEIIFDDHQLSVTPGQSVVFYDGDTVIGGGFIEQSKPD